MSANNVVSVAGLKKFSDVMNESAVRMAPTTIPAVGSPDFLNEAVKFSTSSVAAPVLSSSGPWYRR